MSIDNPKALVDAFKKTGEFDRLRRDLLAEFQKDEFYSAFKGRVGNIIRERLAKAQMLHYLPQDMVLKELSQEVDRYPVVERAVADMRMFSDPSFLSTIQNSLREILVNDTQTKDPLADSEKRTEHENSQWSTQRPIELEIAAGVNQETSMLHEGQIPEMVLHTLPRASEPQDQSMDLVEGRTIGDGEKSSSGFPPADDAMDVDDD